MSSLDLSNWNELTESQRNQVCRKQKLTQTFISEHWKELTEDQRGFVCSNQKLTQAFISKNWNDLTEVQRNRVCNNQKLTQPFIYMVMRLHMSIYYVFHKPNFLVR